MSGKIEQELNRYFLPRELLSSHKKSDGKIYNTYLGWLKQDYWENDCAACFIIKEISKSQYAIYKALSQISHPNLEKVYGILEIDGEYCAINEYIAPPSRLKSDISGRQTYALSLETFMQTYHGSLNRTALSDEDKNRQALLIVLQLCKALQAIRKTGFIHGDIHPGNILLTDVPANPEIPQAENYGFYVKLIDFDNTQVAKSANHMVTHVMGTKQFSAPEILDFTHPLNKADIYSLGCILYYAIHGNSPKDHISLKEKLPDRQTEHIFRKCTASYEARYKNLSILEKDLLHALWIPGNALIAILHKIPGFRTNKLWKKIVACCAYFTIVFTLIISLTDIIMKDHTHLQTGIQNLVVSLFLIVEIIFVCDVFRIGDHFKRYVYFRNVHPIARYLAKGCIGIVILIPYVFVFNRL